MKFSSATVEFHSTYTVNNSQFFIDSTRPIHLTVSGPSRYTYLKLDDKATKTVNALAQRVGIEHENGPDHNQFMVYRGTFRPGNVQIADGSRKATSNEKNVFGQIFKTAAAAIAKQMKWSVRPDDVERIVLEKTVDFGFFSKTQRACCLSIELSQSAANRLGINTDTRFRNYATSSSPGQHSPVYPGQI